MAYYTVEILVDTYDGFRAGFDAKEISFLLTRLNSHVHKTDEQFRNAMDEIAAHDTFAAIVPVDSGGDIFVHRMFNYTTSKRHNADISIDISLYHEDTVTSKKIPQTRRSLKRSQRPMPSPL